MKTDRFRITVYSKNPEGVLDEPEVHIKDFAFSEFNGEKIPSNFWAEDWAYTYTDKGSFAIEKITA